MRCYNFLSFIYFRLFRDRMSDLGAATFVGVFEKYSTAKMFFPVFKDSPLEDIALSEALKNHGLRVMQVRKFFLSSDTSLWQMPKPRAE